MTYTVVPSGTKHSVSIIYPLFVCESFADATILPSLFRAAVAAAGRNYHLDILLRADRITLQHRFIHLPLQSNSSTPPLSTMHLPNPKRNHSCVVFSASVMRQKSVRLGSAVIPPAVMELKYPSFGETTVAASSWPLVLEEN
jgi:hypothetical protein